MRVGVKVVKILGGLPIKHTDMTTLRLPKMKLQRFQVVQDVTVALSLLFLVLLTDQTQGKQCD